MTEQESDVTNDHTMNPAQTLLDNRRWLWAIVYARLGDASATEDVLQEVSVAAIRSDETFAEIGQLKAWLYQVAVRQVMLLRRRESRHRTKLQNYALTTRLDQGTSYVDWLCEGEQIGQVQQAMAQIRPTDRQVLALKYCEELTCKEIANHLGVTETTIQTRLLRARRRLRSLLVKEFEFEE